MEMHYQTHLFADDWDQAANTSQPFMLSMRDSTGYGMHADWFNGFEPATFQKVIDQCSNEGQEAIEDCLCV